MAVLVTRDEKGEPDVDTNHLAEVSGIVGEERCEGTNMSQRTNTSSIIAE